MGKINWIFIVIALGLTSQSNAQDSTQWVARKTKWGLADEQVLQDLVINLGDAVSQRRCNTVSSCMKDKSINFYAASDPKGISHYADCADLPYYLRAYIAWKRDLPFTYASAMATRDPNEPNRTHYSRSGNRVLSRRNLAIGETPTTAPQAFTTLINQVFTGSFRTPLLPEPHEPLADFYPVALKRSSITPGTALYDADGHAYVVYKVEENGNVKYIDAHPDGTLTLSEINNSFSSSRQELGWGFKKYRPYELVGAQSVQDQNGVRYVGGEIVLTPDHEIPDYSVSHLSRTKYKEGERDDSDSFYHFARTRLAAGELTYEILNEFTNVLTGICHAAEDRAFSVQQAITAGIHQKKHPLRLPENIFGTIGEWEAFSSPSRDARLKSAFIAGYEHVEDLIERHHSGDPNVVYEGSDIYRDLWDTYMGVAESCQLAYTNSAGQKVTLTLDDFRRRLWKISFDPYHCIELRWGATGSELATCQDGENKLAWYRAQQPLRNQVERRYDDRMDHTLAELENFTPNSGKGVKKRPEIPLMDLLDRVGN